MAWHGQMCAVRLTSSMEVGRGHVRKGERKGQGLGDGITWPHLSLPVSLWLVSLQAWSDNEEISVLLAQKGGRIDASKKKEKQSLSSFLTKIPCPNPCFQLT